MDDNGHSYDGGNVRDNDGRRSASRRRLLAGAGVTLGAGVLGVGGQAVAHDGHDDGETATPEGTETATATDSSVSDVDVLQYALTLEHLEASFYERGTEMFESGDFHESDDLQHFGESVQDVIVDFVETLGSHEEAHVAQIEATLQDLGEEPAEPPEFTFQFETVDEFLATGRVLENTGVAAYAGAAPHLQNEQLLSAALSIHSVEGRHAAFLNGITGRSPFPQAFDPALSMEQVLEAIQPFIGGETETETATETPTETET